MCNAHSLRMRKYGDPLAGGPPRTVQTKSVAERFWAKVDKSGDCWIWTASTTNYGYGQLHIGGSMVRAHRLSWELANDAIPDGLEVCHSCDTPACVNPAHLWLGTHAENLRDMGDKGRYVVPGLRGEDQWRAKLTEDQVRAIRADPRPGVVVARVHGVSPSSVSLIRKRKSWAWLD